MIVGRAEAGQEYPEKDHDDRRIAMKLPQPHCADRNEGKIRHDVPEVRHAEQSALIGEMVIALVLRDRRQQQQPCERHDHQAEKDKHTRFVPHLSGGHPPLAGMRECAGKNLVRHRPACAASLIRERRRSSSKGSVVSTRPEW